MGPHRPVYLNLFQFYFTSLLFRLVPIWPPLMAFSTSRAAQKITQVTHVSPSQKKGWKQKKIIVKSLLYIYTYDSGYGRMDNVIYWDPFNAFFIKCFYKF